MRVFPIASVLLLSLSAFSFTAKAVSLSELPATIQSCITARTCGVNFSSSFDSGTASAFSITDLMSGQTNWLMRYSLVSPSGETDISGTQSNAYGGHLWMQVANSYSSSETDHAITLFLDKVTPTPGSLFGQNGDLSLFISTADLLAGSASRSQADPGYGDYDSGSLSGEIPLICLAEGCQVTAQLNLLQLKYLSFGSAGIVMTGFDAGDTRGLVYSQSSAYFNGDPPYGTAQAFYISAVPEANTFLMFGFGLMAVVAAVRCREGVA